MSKQFTKRVRFDGCTFLIPNPAADPGVEWLLRYGSESQIIEARMAIAEIIEGYDHLLRTSAKDAISTLRILRRGSEMSKQSAELAGRLEVMALALSERRSIGPVITQKSAELFAAAAAEIERLTKCLASANSQAEQFEREWYLRGDEIERLTTEAGRLKSMLDESRAEVARIRKESILAESARSTAVEALRIAQDDLRSQRAVNERLTGDVERLDTRVRELEAALIEARDSVVHWADYAGDYFRDKHDFAGDLARIDAVIGTLPAPPAQQQGEG